MSGAEESFNQIVGELDYPMLVVTAAAGEEVAGCLVGFASQASISPPRFVVCLSNKNRTYRIAHEAEFLGVHFLAVGDDDLAALFGSETGDEVDKFARISWTAGPAGTPLLEACSNRFVGRILDRFTVGDHVAFLLEPSLAEHGEQVHPFPFQRAKRLEPGHDA
ncbi:MAG: flavin reductase family protein [Actinomycetota bacterium]|nr:flavin reductase family protein [Actinomycetota bacterium]